MTTRDGKHISSYFCLDLRHKKVTNRVTNLECHGRANFSLSTSLQMLLRQVRKFALRDSSQ